MLNLLETKKLFDRWCCSKKIDQNYDKLRQLMLVEEFKHCIQSDVKTFLDEKQVATLEEAARLADDYYLTHKVSFIAKPKPNSSHPQNGLCLVIHLSCPVNPIHPNPILLVKPKVNIPYLDSLVTIVRNLVTLFLNV